MTLRSEGNLLLKSNYVSIESSEVRPFNKSQSSIKPQYFRVLFTKLQKWTLVDMRFSLCLLLSGNRTYQIQFRSISYRSVFRCDCSHLLWMEIQPLLKGFETFENVQTWGFWWLCNERLECESFNSSQSLTHYVK